MLFSPAKSVQKVIIHPSLGEVMLSQSRRARRISISVRPSGGVRLSFPCGVSSARAWAFLEMKTEWIDAARRRQAARIAAEPPLAPAEAKARVEELRRIACADLPARAERLMRQTGLRCNKITIRVTRTKWGSCSGKNHISLSVFLMTLPEQLRDYVIIHELCHTVHHNHSPRFHALVDHHTGGNEKALNRELRAFTIRG